MVVDLSLDSDEDDSQNEAGSLATAAGASRLVGLQANARAGSGRTRSRAAQLSATTHPRTVVPTVESQETGTSGEVLLIDSDHEMAGCSSRPLRDLTLPSARSVPAASSSLRPSSAGDGSLAVAVQAIPAVPPSPTTELNRLKRQLARRDRQIGQLEKDRNAKGEEAEAASRAEAARAAKEVAAAAAAALAAAQGAAPAGSSSMLLVVPPPPNWDPARPGEEAGTMFVRLPWPGGDDW